MTEHEDAVGFLARPAGASAPGVVVIPDVWGLSEHYRGIARRLAEAGFAALAIDPYRKTGRREIADVAAALAWIRELPDPLMNETVQDAIDTFAGAKVGVVGFCMGGQYALLAACACRGLAACAPFYGMVRYEPGLDAKKKPRSPLDALADLTCPVAGFYGAADPIIPAADVAELRERLAKTGKSFEIEVYEGAGHAFMNDTRPEMYRAGAAADAWGRLIAFLDSRLRAS